MSEAKNQIEALSATFGDNVVPSNENNEIIERSADYVVSIRNDKRRLDLAAKPEVHQAIAEDSNLSREFRRAQTLNAQPILNLKVSDQLAYLRLLGNGFAAVFAKQAVDAALAINEAREYLHAKRNNTASVWYFSSSSLTFAVLFFGAWIVLLTQGCGVEKDANEKADRRSNSQSVVGGMESQAGPAMDAEDQSGEDDDEEDQDANDQEGEEQKSLLIRGDYDAILHQIKNFPFVLCFMFGVLGAMVSVLARITALPSDIMAGRVIHYIDGSSRIVAGGIFAIIGSMAFHANVFLGFLNPSDGQFGVVLCLVAVVSGISERLIPSLVASFEDRSTTEQANLNRAPETA